MTGIVTDAFDMNTNRLFKAWWAQAEMLNALIDAYQWTEESKYLNAVVKLFDWVWTYQIDHECGGWYQIKRDGKLRQHVDPDRIRCMGSARRPRAPMVQRGGGAEDTRRETARR